MEIDRVRCDGQLVTGSFQDYAMPRADDFPDLVSELTEVPATTNPLGIKGAGEAGATGAPPAMVSAILDALRPLGIDHIDMPATPSRIWQAIHGTQRGQSGGGIKKSPLPGGERRPEFAVLSGHSAGSAIASCGAVRSSALAGARLRPNRKTATIK